MQQLINITNQQIHHISLKSKIITSQYEYERILNTCIVNSQYPPCDVRTFSINCRATHYFSENNQIQYFTVFCNSWNQKQYNKSIQKFINKLNYKQIWSNAEGFYSQCEIILYLYSNQNYIINSLFYIAIQCYFKQLPLIIPKQSITELNYQYIKNYFDIKEIIPKSKHYISQLIILPTNQKIKELIYDQQNIMINNNLCITDNLLEVYYPIICDTSQTIKINSIMQSQNFLNDPMWSIIQPDQQKRHKAIYLIQQQMQQQNSKYGLNFLFTNQLELTKSVAALTATPPGIDNQFLGNFINPLKVFQMLKYFGYKNIININKFQNIHKQKCHDLNNHIYICGLMTSEQYRRRGIGRQIFKIIYSIANQSKAQIYLENSKSQNLSFYYTMGGLRSIAKYNICNNYNKNTPMYIMLSTQNNSTPISQQQFQFLPEEAIQMPFTKQIRFY